MLCALCAPMCMYVHVNCVDKHSGPVYTRLDSHGHDIKFSHIKAILAPKIIRV